MPRLGLFVVLFSCLCANQTQALTDLQREVLTKWLAMDADDRPLLATLDLPTAMSAEQSAQVLDVMWGLYRESVDDPQVGALPEPISELAKQAPNGRLAIESRALTLGDLTMPFAVIRREPEPVAHGERSLLICMHGGGAKPDVGSAHGWSVNTREWQTQVQFAIRHYPANGIYIIPRMADDRLGRWWHRHNHDAFERVIEHAITHWGVDPNRVYLLGISEGGFGTDILAPFMPDRFAGANAMASGVDQGNPPANLRNLPFRTDVGEKDTMFDRVTLAQAFHERLDELHAKDADGYKHSLNVQAGRGHGIDYRPGVAWITQHTRDAWPSELHWIGKKLHDRRRSRHYWVELDGEVKSHAVRITAKVDATTNAIDITARQLEIDGDGGNPTHAKAGVVTSDEPLTGVTLRVLLRDGLVDLDKPIHVVLNGELAFEGVVKRSAAVQLRTLAGYGDPTMAASAQIVFTLD